ncbi:MAG: helicase associated domain-containing protein [Flavobacteriales bacterium]
MVSKLEKKWTTRFKQLKRFYEKNNHTNISARYKKNKSLGTWVVRQRVIKNTLSDEQIDALNSINFVWNPREDSWENNYAKLVEYKEKNNHTNVPVNYSEDLIFGRWVQKQRRIKNSLSPEKLKQLEQIDFIWDGNEYVWENNYTVLKTFIQTNKRMPNYKENLKLYNWMNQQKIKFNNLRLDDDKVEKLEKIGMTFKKK